MVAGRREVDRGNFEAAVLALRDYLQSNKSSAEGHFLLAYSLFRLNQPKESLAEYTLAAGLRTPTAEDLRYVAQDYVLLSDFDDADKWMLRSVRMNDKDPEGWYAMGRIRYTEQRFHDALVCFQKSLALAPTSVKAETNLGLAYEGLNRTDEAIRSYRKALSWQKDARQPSEQPMLNLGIVLVEQGQLQEALPLLVQAAGIAPKDPRIHEQLGDIYMQTSKLGDAQREFEQAVALSPENSGYHFLLGRVYHKEGMEKQAHAEFERASALNGTGATKDSH